MTEPTPIFDPAVWCEAWLRHGGLITWNGHINQPLACLIGTASLREHLLCELYQRIATAPHHREAVRRFWRSEGVEARRVRMTTSAWRGDYG